MSEKTVHVIPHTHWDFEWYFTHPESSVQLVYHMDDLLQALRSGQLNQYILDGQMSIVEDYLELVPENRQELQRLVKHGHLKTGPWYTQCDQLIVSGESIVRNLLLGIRAAEALGKCWMMGYAPDAFGQSIDMPKIYAGFGIQHSVFWRGLSSDTCPWREFNWRSEDGSEVSCYQIRNGYYLAEPQIAGMAPDDIVAMVSQGSRSTHVPFPFGADQIKTDTGLKDRLTHYNQHTHAGHQFVESSYEALFAGIQAQVSEPFIVEGEMIDAQFSKIHRSIYSTRYDHKQLNDQVETRLTHVLEPLMVLADHLGIPYKSSMVNSIWKQLLRCHAHDSAGGCNSDRTNQQILQRLVHADQMSAAGVDFLLRKLSESVGCSDVPDKVVFYNTLPYARCDRVIAGMDTEQPHFTLHDETGAWVDFTVLKSERCYRGSVRRSENEHDPSLYYYQHQIEVMLALPALGLRCLHVRENSPQSGQSQQMAWPELKHSQSPLQMAHSQCTITFADGRLTLDDHQTGAHWPDFLFVRDMGDDGDNYDYSPPEQDWILRLDFSDTDVQVRHTSLSQTMMIEGSWLLPANLAERQQQKRSVKVPFRLELTLADEQPLDIRLEIENRACDHRMQLVCSTDVMTTDSVADTPFGTVSRPHLHPRIDDWREKSWKEEPSCIYPLLHHVSLCHPEKSLTLLSCGIKEYEVIQPLKGDTSGSGESGDLALTLFRSVGWLGKPDLKRRPGIASGQQFKYIPTPDSQLLQRMSFRSGLIVNRQFNPAEIMQQWQRFAVPALSYQQQELNRFTNTMKYFGVNPLEQPVPALLSLLHVDAPGLVCSALKRAEPDGDGEGVVIRLYNPSSSALDHAGEIQLPAGVTQAFEVNLNEAVCRESAIEAGRVRLGVFAPKQVKTFKFLSV
ncbi:Mannosylglycerate hydrolase [Vibrio aerogenes CECT 7868]|uniref:Mannosylglycerate hydrolase n=1 Tax=Vibrio aerogenes CECT 7868 TaxID=1216006 RepID=A0A1M6DGB9_9VIBR|nr:glycosyl hydrolase-related protein [Vibrio aerogenes]SHI72232.1 Mannosylglycerate hydrolase [Vibrio aerogenes CECT 7868]